LRAKFLHGRLGDAAAAACCHDELAHVPDDLHATHPGLGALTEDASGLPVVEIAGRGLACFQGRAADVWSIRASNVISAACYRYMLAFSRFGAKATSVFSEQPLAAA